MSHPYYRLAECRLLKASGEDFLPLVTSRTEKHVNTSARYNEWAFFCGIPQGR